MGRGAEGRMEGEKVGEGSVLKLEPGEGREEGRKRRRERNQVAKTRDPALPSPIPSTLGLPLPSSLPPSLLPPLHHLYALSRCLLTPTLPATHRCAVVIVSLLFLSSSPPSASHPCSRPPSPLRLEITLIILSVVVRG